MNAPAQPTDARDRGPDETFADYLAEGQFMLQRSRGSGPYVFYPRFMEPETGATDLEWVEASGLATVNTNGGTLSSQSTTLLGTGATL